MMEESALTGAASDLDVLHQSVALFEHSNVDNTWAPVEDSAWIEIEGQKDSSNFIIKSGAHGDGLVFSATIAANMKCSIDNGDETFVELVVSDSRCFGMYFVSEELARAFKQMFDGCIAGTCAIPVALQSSVVPLGDTTGFPSKENSSSRHLSVRLKTLTPSSLADGSEATSSASQGDTKSKSFFRKIYKGTRRRILNLPGQTQTILEKTQGLTSTLFDKLPSKASVFDSFRNLGFGSRGGGTPKTKELPLVDIRSIIDKLSSEELLAVHKVRFVPEFCRFEGCPPEWAKLNEQFGVDYHLLEKIPVEGYAAMIPVVLEMLKRHFIMNRGIDVVGIFRLAPDKEKCQTVMDQINTGTFESCDDVNIIANLIKIFFRNLPQSLCANIPERILYKVAENDIETAHRELDSIDEPWKSVLLWLLDLMSVVVMNEAVNKMAVKNMAICVSPNLFVPNTENPMAALTKAQKVADFMTKVLAARLHYKYQYECDGV